jgi:hypothetical protein
MNAITSIFTSRKTLQVFFGVAATLTTLYFTWPALTTPNAKMAAVLGAEAAIAALFGVNIHGIAMEDAAEKSQPTTQTNVNSDVTNAAPTAAPVAPATPPKPVAQSPQTVTLTAAQLSAYVDRAATVAANRVMTAPRPAPTPTTEQIAAATAGQ